MKHILVLVVGFVLSFFAAAEELPLLTLESADGKEIKARILERISEFPTVYRIEREDGKQYELPLSALSVDSSTAVSRERHRQEMGLPADFQEILVSHRITKHLGAKFHYWFDVRNFRDEPFVGKVKITLENKMPGITNGDATFETPTPVDPLMGLPAKMECHTGPPSVHGGASVVSFRYEVIEEGEVTFEGRGEIPNSLE